MDRRQDASSWHTKYELESQTAESSAKKGLPYKSVVLQTSFQYTNELKLPRLHHWCVFD